MLGPSLFPWNATSTTSGCHDEKLHASHAAYASTVAGPFSETQFAWVARVLMGEFARKSSEGNLQRRQQWGER
jgi:hypothetical protein